ncbi:hypothetical protein ACOZ4N_18910 [Halorientalis pallida]|uniref:hypothetical protein n=1 Tax=Halorientalis pallida TaxID=2479928 RepID=UPI003C6F142A
MSGAQPITTVETDPKPAVFSGGAIFMAGFFGVLGGLFGGDFVASLVGVEESVGTILAGVGVFLLLEALFYVGNRRGAATFYRDRVRFNDDAVAYDDVSAAVRMDSLSRGLFGTADYELIAHGEENLRLRYVTEPDEVERVLDDRLPSPEERLSAADTGDHDEYRRSRYLTSPWNFWDYWDEEEPVPESAVVEDDVLERVMDVDPGDADLDELDDVDMDAADGLGDIDAGDVGADSGGADGGGGFDGGGGGGGE